MGNKPSCFGSYAKTVMELNKGVIWKCNCYKCPRRMECSAEEMKEYLDKYDIVQETRNEKDRQIH